MYLARSLNSALLHGRDMGLASMVRICLFASRDSLSALDPFVCRYHHNDETDQHKNEDYTMPQHLLVS